MTDNKPRKRTALIIIAIFLIALVGVSGYYYWRYQQRKEKDSNATFIKPRMELQQLHFKRFAGKDTKLDITLKIHNPSPIGVTVDSLHYTVFMANEQIAESRRMEKQHINSSDSSLIVLKLQLDNDAHRGAFEKAMAAGKDSTSYELRAELFIDVPVLKGKSIRYKLIKVLPAFMLPHVKMKDVKVEKAGLSKTSVILKTQIVNPNSFPMRFKDARYVFVIDNDTLQTGTIDYVVHVPPRDSAALEIPIEMKTGKALKTATALLLEPNETTYYYYFQSSMISSNPAFEESTAVTEARGKLSDLKNGK